jgi:hypothetical protein
MLAKKKDGVLRFVNPKRNGSGIGDFSRVNLGIRTSCRMVSIWLYLIEINDVKKVKKD